MRAQVHPREAATIDINHLQIGGIYEATTQGVTSRWGSTSVSRLPTTTGGSCFAAAQAPTR